MLSRAREIAYCYFSSRIQCSQTLDGYLPRLPHNRRYQSYPTAVADMVRPLKDAAPPYAHIRRGLQSTPTPAL